MVIFIDKACMLSAPKKKTPNDIFYPKHDFPTFLLE